MSNKNELEIGASATHNNIYNRVKLFKAQFHNQPEPIIWFTCKDDEKGLRVHFGDLDEYRHLGYGQGNDPEYLVFSFGTGVYHTLTEQLNSESIKKVEQVLYQQVHEIVDSL